MIAKQKQLWYNERGVTKLLQNTFLVAQQVTVLFLLMGAGGIAAKAGWLREDGAGQLTAILLYIVTPSVIIQSFITAEFTPELVNGMLRSAVFAAGLHLFGAVTAHPLFKKQPHGRRGVFNMALTFSNCGFMGVPLVAGILGEAAVVYVSVFLVIFNLFSWTYGVAQFHRRPAGGNVNASQQEKTPLCWRTTLINPGTLSLAAGLLAALLRFEPPMLIGEPLRLFAALNSPVAMLVLGYYLFTTSLRPQKGDAGMWVAITVRLVIAPAIALALSAALGLSGLWLSTSLILTAAPSAVNALLFAAKFGGDTALAARTVSWCTLLSMLTMPVVLGVALGIG
jgi:hypothetical protein